MTTPPINPDLITAFDLGRVMLPKLETLIRQAKKNDFQGVLLALDPGETTGATIVRRTSQGTELIGQFQWTTWPLEEGVHIFDEAFRKYLPDIVVHEAYHVYKWRLEEHTFSEVPTIQIVGSIRTLAILHGVPYRVQTAQVGKGFFTDRNLKNLDIYFPGMPHARDSLRHAAQWLAFGGK